MSILAAAAQVVAEKPVLTEDTVRPGLIGLFFFVALFVATYFLWRSMNKQLRKVDEHFDEENQRHASTDATATREVSAQEQIAIDQAALGRRGRDDVDGETPPNVSG